MVERHPVQMLGAGSNPVIIAFASITEIVTLSGLAN